MNKLKVYGVNLDGRHRGIVAAPSQKDAARLFGTSANHLRAYGGETKNKHELEVALSDPGRVYMQSYSRHRKSDPWEPRP